MEIETNHAGVNDLLPAFSATIVEDKSSNNSVCYRATLEFKKKGMIRAVELDDPMFLFDTSPKSTYLKQSLSCFTTPQQTIMLTLRFTTISPFTRPDAIGATIHLETKAVDGSVITTRQRVTILIPRLVIKTLENQAKLILPIFKSIYESLIPCNDLEAGRNVQVNIDGRKAKFPLFTYILQNVGKDTVKDTTARLEIKIGERRIGIGNARIGDLQPGQNTRREIWVSFSPGLIDVAPTTKADAVLTVTSPYSAPANKSISCGTIGAIDEMAWCASVLRMGNNTIATSSLNDLDLLHYVVLWVSLHENNLFSKDLPMFKAEHDDFLHFVGEIKKHVNNNPDPKTIAGEILIGLSGRKFDVQQQVFLVTAIQGLQKVYHPEFTLAQKAGNCVNLSILFCSVVEMLGQADVLSTGICFVGDGRGNCHAIPCILRKGSTANVINIANKALWGLIGSGKDFLGQFETDAKQIIKAANGNIKWVWTREVLRTFF